MTAHSWLRRASPGTDGGSQAREDSPGTGSHNPPPANEDAAGARGLELRLRLLADQILMLASEVSGRHFCTEAPASSASPAPTRSPGEEGDRWLDMAENLYRQRRRRMEVLPPPHIFGEPGWDMLLDLYIAERRGQLVSITSACIGAQVSHLDPRPIPH